MWRNMIWWNKFKQWMKSPLNVALFLWIIPVAVTAVILVAAATGMLNNKLSKSQKDGWVEACGQILTALVTLIFLYQHPTRIYHLILLRRWDPEAISMLRKAYSKNATYKPRERFHMTVVAVSYNVNYLAQYGLSGLNVGYDRHERPHGLMGFCIATAVVSGILSNAYATKSPLGRDYESEEVQSGPRYSLGSQMVAESAPKWRGGLLNVWDDAAVSSCALSYSCCLHGWNMQRLGFGNMYVHAATFILYCIAPAVIFITAAIHIDNEAVKGAVRWTGVVVSFFGFLYGGYWRIKIRERYNLPRNTLFCGIADCAQWTCCCCCCSLAQEVRTADYYDILLLENGGNITTLPSQAPVLSNANSSAGPSNHEMIPPLPPLFKRQEN